MATLNTTIVLMAAILVVVDFFLPTDVPTHIAYVLLCALVGLNVDGGLLVRILFALVAWFALVAFHYCLWQRVLQKVANRVIAPDRFRSGVAGTVGCQGVVRLVEGKRMVQVNGDLWPCRGAGALADGTPVEVVAQADGELEVAEERNH